MAQQIILCVDADPGQLGQLSQWISELELPDFQCIAAPSGQEAIEALKPVAAAGGQLAVVVAANATPGIPVPELLTLLRREHPFLQAILTILPEEEESRKKKTLALPAHALRIEVPVDQTHFVQAMRTALMEWTRIQALVHDTDGHRRLNNLVATLREMSVLNSFHNAFLQACCRQTDARRAIFFQRNGDAVKVVSLVADEMDENIALQRELQQSSEALSQRFAAHLVGSKAELPTRIVLSVYIMGEPSAYVLLEREDDAPPFDPLCHETARTLCLFLGELETSRIMRSRSAHDRRTLETARREHHEMKQLAALQHQNLEQSIRYARLAAGSVMPPPAALNRMYEDAFLLFRPRDVVSGTFYWFGERYYKFMIAVADTRVPGIGGTFLTLLHHRLIDEIANDQALPKPRGMLLDLGERIKETLGSQQTAGATASYQGLRIGLVSVDESVQVLRFAGADIPLWLVRDGEVKRLNSSTTPLGTEPFPGHRTEIKQHTLQLSDNDRVYVCTPGLLELKGGHDNSPFGAERFRKLLQDIAILPLHDQPAALDLKIDEWLDGRPPTHDVLLLGLQMPE